MKKRRRQVKNNGGFVAVFPSLVPETSFVEMRYELEQVIFDFDDEGKMTYDEDQRAKDKMWWFARGLFSRFSESPLLFPSSSSSSSSTWSSFSFLTRIHHSFAVSPSPLINSLQMAMEVTQILLNAQAVDGNVRKHAEENLRQFQEQNLPSFLLSLAGELANDDKPVESRKLAGLILKNALDAKEQHRKFELGQRWLSLDPSVKAQIKACLLKTLSSPAHDARSTASQVVAKLAGIELPLKQWPELIEALLSNNNQLPAHTRQATLETLGYICEEVSPDVVEQDQVNKMLTAVVQGMNSSETNNDVRLAATRALHNALGFAQANFSNDMERDYIVRVVCEATLSPEVKIRQAAFECLVSISSTYYEKLAPYIQDIFSITAKAVKEDEEPVALQAIEFWSSICDEEIDILEEYGGDFTGDSVIPCYYFIKQALPALIPLLLETLLKQEEDQDQDEVAWNVAMAGGTCLGLVARTVGDDVVPLVMPFIEENITKPDWRQREAATYAFGSILEGPSPDKLMPLVNVALNFMLNALMKDPNNHVKDTTGWTLGRIFEFLHGSTLETPIITQANCQQIITVLLQSMKDVPNVAEKACGALYFLAQGFEDAGPSSSPLAPFFQDIIQALLDATHREDAGESRLRTAAYEALNEVVRCSTDDTAPMVMQLVPLIMMELHQTLEAQKLSSDEREKQNELQGLLCGCLQVIIQKLGSSEPTKYVFLQYADQMMGLFLRVFACKSATAHEEAMLAIGALVYSTGADFVKYMTEFYKYLEMGLQNFEDYQSAAELSAHTSGVDDDMIEYTNTLRNGIMEAYSGILQGFKGSAKTHLLMPYAPHVLQFLDSLYIEKDMDDFVIKTAIGLLGDLADTLGSAVGSLIQQSVSARDFLNECLTSDDPSIKEAAEWVKIAISRATNF
ncbi:importin subunit beta-1 [Prunus yedoensis var. nudiflora]|uniref:Importin subunit beta-1 n=1 Tax=Prunus yedoensis var. nudiflora TaxID=2094558 RepID=A0A314UZ51_PRUYE|nr:importin subunit beta-1 [Prunus yedoensis var. nudiflora]